MKIQMMKKPDLKIILGNRREFEFQLLYALFTPGAGETVAMLSKQLSRKGKGRLQAVKASLPEDKAPYRREPNDE